MRIVVLHNAVDDSASAADRDVLTQRDAVAESLNRLGHDAVPLACTLNLEAVARELKALQPDLVFNLVESLGGTDRLMPLATMFLDALSIPYTGCPTAAIIQTGDKLTAKRMLTQTGLPTPAVASPRDSGLSSANPGSKPAVRDRADQPRTYIIKAVCEHASLGMDDGAVATLADAGALDQLVVQRSAACGFPCFAEEYIDGREFNLSLLADGAGPRVLPPAEIVFDGLDEAQPRIVGYRAKWDEDSAEYLGTPRRFDFPEADAPLLRELERLATACWSLFGLRGYARVDFRVDSAGRPFILEINANPCLSPDAGFAAAVSRASLTQDEAIDRIVRDALNPRAV